MLFRCFIRGENFPGKLIGSSRPCGFYTTRWVEAESEEEAEELALAALKADSSFGVDGVPEAQKARARIYFEEIIEMDPSSERVPDGGATWFKMEDGANPAKASAGQ